MNGPMVIGHNRPTKIERSKPAFPGARFDANGFCVAHPKTRLCKPTEDGKFKIVRKTCQRCGTAALMSDPRTVKTNVHGYKRKPSKHREIQGLITAGAGNGSEPQIAHRRNQSHKENLAVGFHGSETKAVYGRSTSVTRGPANSIPRPHMKTKILRHSISSSDDEANETDKDETPGANRNARGNSPPRSHHDRNTRKSVRNSTNSSSNSPPCSHNDGNMRKSLRNSSDSSSGDEAKEQEQTSGVGGNDCDHTKRKLRHRSSRGFKDSSSDEADAKENLSSGGEPRKSARRSRTLSPSRKLECAVSPVKSGQPSEYLKSSYFRKVSEELSPAHMKKVLHTKFLSKRSTGKVVTSLPVVDETKKRSESKRYCVPFNKKGYCNIHADVQLAKVDKKGVWILMLDVCPQCSEDSKPTRTRSSSLDRKSGKVKHALKQLKNSEKFDEAVKPAADENETAMVIYSEKSKEAKAAAAPADATTETALVLAEPASTKLVKTKDSKMRRSLSAKSLRSLTSVTASPDFQTSMPSPAFSCPYFTGGATGFPSLPLLDDPTLSLEDTVKRSNTSLAASNKRTQSRSKLRVVETVTDEDLKASTISMAASTRRGRSRSKPRAAETVTEEDLKASTNSMAASTRRGRSRSKPRAVESVTEEDLKASTNFMVASTRRGRSGSKPRAVETATEEDHKASTNSMMTSATGVRSRSKPRASETITEEDLKASTNSMAASTRRGRSRSKARSAEMSG